MHIIGGERWSIQIRQFPDELVVALYVREALDLATTLDVPEPLTPPPPNATGAINVADRASAARDWHAWWSHLISARWQDLRGAPQPSWLSTGVTGIDQLLLHPLRPDPVSPLTVGVYRIAPAARDYVQQRQHEAVERHVHDRFDYASLVEALVAKRQRRPRNFLVEIQVLPVAGSRSWIVGIDGPRARACLQVSENFLTRPQSHGQQLERVLAEVT